MPHGRGQASEVRQQRGRERAVRRRRAPVIGGSAGVSGRCPTCPREPVQMYEVAAVRRNQRPLCHCTMSDGMPSRGASEAFNSATKPAIERPARAGRPRAPHGRAGPGVRRDAAPGLRGSGRARRPHLVGVLGEYVCRQHSREAAPDDNSVVPARAPPPTTPRPCVVHHASAPRGQRVDPGRDSIPGLGG